MKTYKQAVEMLAEMKADAELSGMSSSVLDSAVVVADIYDVVLEQVLADVEQVYAKVYDRMVGA
jgi:hypothetical protein